MARLLGAQVHRIDAQSAREAICTEDFDRYTERGEVLYSLAGVCANRH